MSGHHGGVVIRDFQGADMPVVHRLIGQLGYAMEEAEFRRRLERVSTAVDHRLIVAEDEGGVVGVLHVFERPALDKGCEAIVQALVVDSDRRGSGIGEMLMREAEAWAALRGLSSVSLYTRIDRDKAHAFYERIGYRQKASSHLMSRSPQVPATT
jgi:GNAT superfamily N-acetyltransferase